MVSRIRLDAFGETAAAVEQALNTAAHKINEALEADAALDGDMVIERSSAEPYGTRHAYRGRLSIHPDTQETLAQGTVGSGSSSNFQWNVTQH